MTLRPRRLRTGALAALLLLLAAQAATACPVCFGDPNDPMTVGVKNGVLSLLAIVVTVLIAFAAFFVTLMVRARRHAATAAPAVAPSHTEDSRV